jgi:hypothetical protein
MQPKQQQRTLFSLFLVDQLYIRKRTHKRERERKIMGFLSGMIGGCVGYGCQIFSNAVQKVPLSRRTYPTYIVVVVVVETFFLAKKKFSTQLEIEQHDVMHPPHDRANKITHVTH